ncbi:MAG: DUF1501 domain-containing protein, partial [Planctomycetales bacterium]|nr:DUF1501 domain-containing protein [Planctomycetales bacterium]
MLSFTASGPKLCDGIARREFLRVGGLSAFGLSAGIAASAANAAVSSTAKAKRCIVLFLMGGPPQHSTWDPKPDNAAEIRGA